MSCHAYHESHSSVRVLGTKVVVCLQIASQQTTVMHALRGIVSDGGIGALFRGLGAASVRVVPMALVSFGTYEVVRSQCMQLEESWALVAAEEEMKGCCRIASEGLTCEV